ncbi:MAG: YybH family protein, partial [Gemmata sp.]
MGTSLRVALAAGLVVIGVVFGIAFGTGTRPGAAAEPAKGEDPKPSPDEAAAHKALEAFVAAFNENDAKKLAASLTATAEYIDDDSRRLEGAAAIEQLMAKYFTNNKGAKLQVTPDGARSVAPGVVIEDGESVITVPDKRTQSVRKLTIVYAKVEQAWKIASVREYPEEPQVISAEERLKDLAWFVGEWVDEGGDSLVTNSVRMAPDKTHLIREFSVKRDGAELLKGMQWIGVDALTGNIKGWSFDAAGGRSETTWARNGTEWL